MNIHTKLKKYFTLFLKTETVSTTPSTNKADPCGSKSPMMITKFDNKEIVSPNFPRNYPDNLDCGWHIHAGPRHTIRLSFIEFKIHRRYICFNLYVFKRVLFNS